MVSFRRKKEQTPLKRLEAAHSMHSDDIYLMLESCVMMAGNRISQYRTSPDKEILLTWIASDLEAAALACGELTARSQGKG